MIEIDIVQLISTLGFPIAVTVYLLWERHKRDSQLLKNFEKAISQNTEMLGRACEVITHEED